LLLVFLCASALSAEDEQVGSQRVVVFEVDAVLSELHDVPVVCHFLEGSFFVEAHGQFRPAIIVEDAPGALLRRRIAQGADLPFGREVEHIAIEGGALVAPILNELRDSPLALSK